MPAGLVSKLNGEPPSCVAALGAIVLLGLFGCTETHESAGTSTATLSRDRGRIVIELPAGLSVGLGGQEPVPLPVEALDVTPGSHTLVLASACQRVELAVDVAGGETRVVDRERAPGLAWATLQVTAQDREGTPQLHAVMLGDTVVGGGHGTSTTTVPACPHRVRIAHDGPERLGGVVEDIDFGKEREVARTVVLAPGPEMVRLAGGKFTLGPPEAQKERYMEDGVLGVSQIPVTVMPFEIDRTEVTAAQWNECRAVANPQRCFSEADCERPVGCPQRAYLVTHFPPQTERPFCNADLVDVLRPTKQGQENHPMNCVARWEAEDYCRWAGKRLPTAIEWEYAARSGDDRTLRPWGNDEPDCTRGQLDAVRILLEPERSIDQPCHREGTAPVCSFMRGNSRQGVCDLEGNVTEYVGRGQVPGAMRNVEYYAILGSSWSDHVHDFIVGGGDFSNSFQAPDVGFRCARSIAVVARGEP